MNPAAPGCLYLEKRTTALELLPELQKGLNALRKDTGGTVDISTRFLNHFAGTGLLFAGETVGDDRVLEIVNFDPVMNKLVAVGTARPYPWAPLHWLVFRTCPECTCIVQVYDDPAAARHFHVDREGIEKLEPTLRTLRERRFVKVEGLGTLAVGTGIMETVGMANRKMD